MRITIRPTFAGRIALAAIVATTGVAAPAAMAQTMTQTMTQKQSSAMSQSDRPEITKVVYRKDKQRLVITGTGIDESVVVRVNGREVAGQRKFVAEKKRLRIGVSSDQLGLKPDGQNRVEVARGSMTSEFTF